MATLPDLLKLMVEMQGSDLHLSIGSPPQSRVHGELIRMTHPDLTPTDTKSLSYAVLTDAQKKRFEETKELDFSFGIRGLARFRCNMVEADEGQIRQILWNLATNGLRAMPKGGTLCLSALCEDTAAGPSAVLLIEDEGVGIAPEDVDSIFQPFRGSFGKGTGLGLAIVHRIVTDYGGGIEVRPRPAGGTVFRVSFPERADLHVERQAS